MAPSARSDSGVVRAHPELAAEAAALRLELPTRSAAQIASIIFHRHGVWVSERTVRAQLRRAGLQREALAAEPKIFGRYEAARANERWITDVLVGPFVPHPRIQESVRAKLFLIVDDHSRLLVDGAFYAHENARACQELLRRAIVRRGVPEVLYADNGAPFKNAWLARTSAVLGVRLVHSQPYSRPLTGQCGWGGWWKAPAVVEEYGCGPPSVLTVVLLMAYRLRGANRAARVDANDTGWALAGPDAVRFDLVNAYLGYLIDRRYSPRTVRSYAFDLLHFCRWLAGEDLALPAVTTDVLLRYLAACREAVLPGQRGGNVVDLRSGRAAGYAPATVNRRLAAISGLFSFRAMRDPEAANPVPCGPAAKRTTKGERSGMLGHLARPKARSQLRVREPRRLPRGLTRDEARALVNSFLTDRDRAIFGLMLFSGLRSAEVLGLEVTDIDIGRGWVRVIGKGDKERRVPLDTDVAGLVQTYLLAERPETVSATLFVVAKGAHRGQPLTPAGLRRVFRYHRERAGVPAGHPHALRHSFGTALAEAGVDLAVMQALLGHDHVDSAAAYIHLSPTHVRRAYDDARARQRSQAAGR